MYFCTNNVTFQRVGGSNNIIMYMKANSILTSLILLLALFHSGSMKAQKLVLWHSDGSTTEVELFNQPLVQFSGDKVLITSPVLNMEYDKTDVIRFTYKDIDTGISTLTKETDIEQKDGQIVFHDVSSADRVAIYKADGIRVPVRLSFSGSDATLPLSQLPSGVYLFSVNGRTSKFTKK